MVLGGEVAGCSVEELGTAVESMPEVELGASDKGTPVVVLGASVEGAIVVVAGAAVLDGSAEGGLGDSVKVELGSSVEVGGAVVATGSGLQGKGWSAWKGAQQGRIWLTRWCTAGQLQPWQ